MEYGKLVSVTGLPGLFELLSSKADGGVVKSLEDKSTKFVSTRVHNFSHLESIEVFTTKENVNLVDVFTAMAASKEKMPADSDAAAVKKYFQKVYPDMDFERVYASDMKKMVKWYGILTANKIEIKLSKLPENDAATHETAKAKPTAVKAAAVTNAPARKINTPRKMA
jgi:predicted nucleotidyltransferase